MKTKLSRKESGTLEMTEPAPRRKQGFALLMRLLWAAGLLLPAFAIHASVILSSLYSFHGPPNGAAPVSSLVQGADGYFYGTTSGGGVSANGGYGMVFKMDSHGVVSNLYSFTNGIDGASPEAALVQGSDGNFYGTTEEGGSPMYQDGSVFKISTNGALTPFYTFSTDGATPYGGVVQISSSNFYGTSYDGGASNFGTVFELSTNGTLITAHSFTGRADGANPTDTLAQGNDGNLYGTTEYGGTNGFGTVFKVSTLGTVTGLHSFTNGTEGANPYAGLVLGSDGNFYGTTQYGGKHNYGTVFRVTTNGTLTTLYSFTGGTDGNDPVAGLVQGSDGDFYGGAFYGGSNGFGTLFKISTNGTLTSLYSFTNGIDGANPFGGLVRGSNNTFYGTTDYGGDLLVNNGSGFGAIYRLTVVPSAPVFQVVTVTNGSVNLTWSTGAGGVYQLQYSSDLNSTNWINLSNAVTATGATLNATNFFTNAGQRFYRVVLSP